MAEREREPRAIGSGRLEGRSAVAVWLRLSAPVAQREELYETVEAFCGPRANARVVPARGARGARAHVYIVVDSGDLSGVVGGDARAVAGLATVRAVVSRLFMFEPVIVPEPAGEQSA